jgi:hypothetical protein
MTAQTLTPPRTHTQAPGQFTLHRIVATARMQLVNKTTFVTIPAMLVAASWALVAVLWMVIRHATGWPDHESATSFINGAQQAIIYYTLVIGIQALAYVYPFALAMSLTRREFFLGTTGLAAVYSAVLAAIFGLGTWLEHATGGLGLDYYFFTGATWFPNPSAWAVTAFTFTLCLMGFLIGFTFGTLYKRGGAMLVWFTALGLAILILALVVVATWQHWWPAIGHFLARQTPLTLSGWFLVADAALAAISYRVLRRALP